MNLEDCEVGRKVCIPTQKTGEWAGPIEGSIVLQKAKGLGQDYLFITGYLEEDGVMVNEILDEQDGDFFSLEDLELYPN